MAGFYLIVGTDHDGDAYWMVARSLSDARRIQDEGAEICYGLVKVWWVDGETLAPRELSAGET